MESFKLTNLRELSTEEQLCINGGNDSTGCEAQCSCSCTCSCDDGDPSFSIKKESAQANKDMVAQRKLNSSMQSM